MEHSRGAVKTACDAQVDGTGRQGQGVIHRLMAGGEGGGGGGGQGVTQADMEETHGEQLSLVETHDS